MKLLFLIIATAMTLAGCRSVRTDTVGEMPNEMLIAQLQKIIDRIPIGFEDIKENRVSIEAGSNVYASTITLQGTFDNQITELTGRPCFIGKIADVKTEEEATKLVKQWTGKLEMCLHNIETKKVSFRTGGTKSELVDGIFLFFLNQSHGVSVCWRKYPESKIFNVMVRVI